MEDLRQMGLTDADLQQLDPLFQNIIALNNKSKADSKIRAAIQAIQKKPVGNGLFIQGKRVVSMKNVTQDDGYGDTADKIFVLEDGQELGESIEGGTKFETLTKCISNPTCKRFGCEDLIPEFKKIAAAAVIAYKTEMSAKFGANETEWPSRVKTAAAVNACHEVAVMTANNFNALPEDVRKAKMTDILKCEDGKLTANLLRMVDKNCTTSTAFLLQQRDINKSNPTFKVEGVFLKMYLDDDEVGSTQVKFNNGVYHKGKTSSIYTSWNATAYLTKLFVLTPLA